MEQRPWQDRQARIDQLHALHRGKTALLVIDMQRGFLEPGAALEVPAGRGIIENVQRLAQAFRVASAPVIFTRFVYSPAIPCLRGDPFGPEHLPAPPGEATGLGRPSSNCLIGPGAPDGPDSAAIVEALAPEPGELVVDGRAYDKFLGTPLDLALRSAGVEYLVVTGVTTDVCVNSTVLAAANRNYRVTVVSDGAASPWPELHEACLRIWEKKFARLRTAAEVEEEISNFAKPM